MSLEKEAVKNYREMDEMKSDIKEQVDNVLLEISKFISKSEKNYEIFLDNPELVFSEFTNDMIEKNNDKFKTAVKLGERFGKVINGNA